MIEAATLAVSILAERSERKRLARLIRAANPKVLLNLRVSGESAEILDRAATNRGETIDVFVERTIREAANG